MGDQTWRTPWDFYKLLDFEFEFELDAAASKANALCLKYYSLQNSGLTNPWIKPGEVERVFCNPGFAKHLPWINKAIHESKSCSETKIAFIGLCSPSTEWWRLAVINAAEIRLLSPRVQFIPAQGVLVSTNSRENVVIIFKGDKTCKQAEIFTWYWEDEMSVIEDLKKSISKMSTEELKTHIAEIRKSRRQPKAGKKVNKKVAAKKTASAMLDGLSAEDAAALLESIGGEG